MVRDRVLETLRLTASELKSDVSTNSTNPAYLTYIMDYIILYCICQEFFDFFCWRLISMGRNKGQNKEPSQACPSFLPFEERYRSQQVFPCCQNIGLLSASVLTVSRLSNNVNKPQRVVQDVRIELLFLFPKQGCYHYTSSCILHAPSRNRTDNPRLNVHPVQSVVL